MNIDIKKLIIFVFTVENICRWDFSYFKYESFFIFQNQKKFAISFFIWCKKPLLILQIMKKYFGFRDFVPKGRTNFGCLTWKFLSLNYSQERMRMQFSGRHTLFANNTYVPLSASSCSLHGLVRVYTVWLNILQNRHWISSV